MKLKAAMAAVAAISASGTGIAETGGRWSVAEVRQNGQYSVVASSPPVNGATLSVVCSRPEVDEGELSIAVENVSAPAEREHYEQAMFSWENGLGGGILFARARRLGEGSYEAVRDGTIDSNGKDWKRHSFDETLDAIVRRKSIEIRVDVLGFLHRWNVSYSFPLDGSAVAVREVIRACEHARPSGPEDADNKELSATARGTGKHARFGPCAIPLQHISGADEDAVSRFDPAALHRVNIARWQATVCSEPDGLSKLFSPEGPPFILAGLATASALGYGPSQSLLWQAYGALHADGSLTHLTDPDAERLFLEAYLQDNPDAQYRLGMWYERGSLDFRSLAQLWWQRAAQQGHADAQAWLGRSLAGITGTSGMLAGWVVDGVVSEKYRESIAKGWEWIERAAAQGSPLAAFDLGARLIRPEWSDSMERVRNHAGAAYDSHEAVSDALRGVDMLREAVTMIEGPDAARYALSLAHLLGWNLAYIAGTPDGSETKRIPDEHLLLWYVFRRLTSNGPPLLQVADQFRRVREAIHDPNEALRWYRYAGSRGDAQVWKEVSSALYGDWERVWHVGKVPGSFRGYQNQQEATRWLRAAALQGDLWSQVHLGRRYADGIGVPKDNVRMYAWWNIATTASVSPGDFPIYGRSRFADFLSSLRARLEFDFHVSPSEAAQGQALARELYARISANTERTPQAKSVSQGTGILFAAGTAVVTNHHVVEGCSQVAVTRDGQVRSAAVSGKDAGNDLALLDLDRPLRGGDAHLRHRSKVSVGERAMVAGFPLTSGDGFTVTTGNISATRGPAGRTGLFQLTAPVQQGNSGGPVIGADGAILGVVVSKLDAIAVAATTGDLPQNVNYAVHGAVLRTFLDLNGVDYRTLARLGRRSDAELADVARRFTVLVTCTPDT